MRSTLFVTMLLAVGLGRTTEGQAPVITDNPCDVLSRSALESAGSVVVTEVRRAPGISKIVQAQRENTEPGPGTICVFETQSAFGAVSIAVQHYQPEASALLIAIAHRIVDRFR